MSRLDLFRGGYERLRPAVRRQPYGRMRPPVSLSRRWPGVSPSTASDRGTNSTCSNCPGFQRGLGGLLHRPNPDVQLGAS